MTFYMMHTNKWYIFCKCYGLGCSHANEKSANKSRSICDCNRIYVIQCALCLFERLSYDLCNLLYVLSRSYLRHNTSIKCMDIYL